MSWYLPWSSNLHGRVCCHFSFVFRTTLSAVVASILGWITLQIQVSLCLGGSLWDLAILYLVVICFYLLLLCLLVNCYLESNSLVSNQDSREKKKKTRTTAQDSSKYQMPIHFCSFSPLNCFTGSKTSNKWTKSQIPITIWH